MEDNQIRSSIDAPSIKDSLGIDKYVEGVAEYISTSQTPLSISIQGDWGSGKTSLLLGIEKYLTEKDIRVIWFNAWEASQFNMDNQLSLSFFKRLVRKLEGKEDIRNNKILNMLKYIGFAAAGYFTKVRFDERTLDRFLNSDDDKDFEELKEELKKMIDKHIDNGKLVVYIDDLDRIEPVKAVELMEVIKNFLDIEKCIFIYAIDFNIVKAGVEKKYPGIEGEKGKKFFDKIIQLSLRMPVDLYNIDNYVRELFGETHKEKIETYIELLRRSAGNNPRAIKRIYNLFELYSYLKGNALIGETNDVILFSILCIQSEFDDLYSDLLDANIKNCLMDFLSLIKNSESFDATKFDNWKSINQKNYEFLKYALGLIDKEKFSEFVSILKHSTATSVHTN